jgi:L-seryl-tRNA(Ser) seleniumtransferase
VLEAARAAVETDPGHDPDLPALLGAALARRFGRPPRRVLNATGILVHTNLGRAPLPREVSAFLAPLLDAGCDLELDLETGRRGDRNRHVSVLLEALTGAEAALVTNNNAAALLLAVAALAAGREVVVGRGELVEIGGSFRIPEILASAGARLVEVGTTNRTRLADYAAAIGPRTGLVLKVLPSNYRLTGFVAEVAAGPLAELARRHSIPLLVDEGSGWLTAGEAPPPESLRGHPSVADLLAAGADLVCGSGDKLLGGPQAGLLAGRQQWVAACHRHPLFRALRPGRLTLVALAEVLRRHLAGAPSPLAHLWPEPGAHRARLERLVEAIDGRAAVVAAEAFLGGGSAPERPIPGEAVAIPADEDLARRLRLGDPAVLGYLRDGALVLDLRTVDPEDDEALIGAVIGALGQAAGSER